MRSGEPDRARAILEHEEAGAAARGDQESRPFFLIKLARLEWYAGQLARALERARSALALADEVSGPHHRAIALRDKSNIETDLGLADEARRSAETALELLEPLSNEWFTLINVAALGRLELVHGNVEAAADHLRDVPARLHAMGINDPAHQHWTDAVEALVQCGELDLARTYVELQELYGDRVGSPWAKAGAARGRGLLAAAEGDHGAAVAAFERSLAELEGFPHPLERARTLLCLGSTQRRAKQKLAAREPLEQAVGIFERHGARPWA